MYLAFPPGNANLPIGLVKKANREIGVPRIRILSVRAGSVSDGLPSPERATEAGAVGFISGGKAQRLGRPFRACLMGVYSYPGLRFAPPRAILGRTVGALATCAVCVLTVANASGSVCRLCPYRR